MSLLWHKWSHQPPIFICQWRVSQLISSPTVKSILPSIPTCNNGNECLSKSFCSYFCNQEFNLVICLCILHIFVYSGDIYCFETNTPKWVTRHTSQVCWLLDASFVNMKITFKNRFCSDVMMHWHILWVHFYINATWWSWTTEMN